VAARRSGPPVAIGKLPSQSTYVQPYEAVKTNTCPPSLETGPGSVEVHVEGVAHSVLMTFRRAREIKNCHVFRAGPAHIEG